MTSNYLIIDKVTGSIAELNDQVIVNKDLLTEQDYEELNYDSGAIGVAEKYGYPIDPFKIEIVTKEEVIRRYKENNYQITETDQETTMLDMLGLFSVLLETNEEHWIQGIPNDVY